MKKVILTMLTSVLFVGGAAHADYQCTDLNNEISMTVSQNHTCHLGDTFVLLVSGTKQTETHLFGTIHSEGGVLLQKKVVNFFNSQDTLTIVSRPKICGRGACDPNASPVITANLKIGDTETYFSCDETSL